MFTRNAENQPFRAEVYIVKMAGRRLVFYHDKGQI